jgi:hypothetical protein
MTEVRGPVAAPIPICVRARALVAGRTTEGQIYFRKTAGVFGRRGGGGIRGGGSGGAAGLLRLRCGWEAAVRVGNPDHPFLYRGSAGWLGQARQPGRLVGLSCATRGLPHRLLG